MKLSKKLVGSICAGLALVVVASATYAWFTSKDSVQNHFETALIDDGSVKIVEKFDPPKKWEPGKVTKEVGVANNGEIPVFVRVSFEEMLDKLNMPAKGFATEQGDPNIAVPFNTKAYDSWTVASTTNFPNGITGADGLIVKFKSVIDSTNGKTVYSFIVYKDGAIPQRVTADYKVSDDGKSLTVSNVQYWYYTGRTIIPAVAWSTRKDNTGATPAKLPTDPKFSAIDENKNILLNYSADYSDTITANKWYYNKDDGFFYFVGKLEAGANTPLLLETVELSGNADNSYAGMKYDLFVNMDAIQLTKEALTGTPGWGLTNQPLVDAMAAAAGI